MTMSLKSSDQADLVFCIIITLIALIIAYLLGLATLLWVTQKWGILVLTVIETGAMVVLVAITGAYAWHTQKMVKEARKDRVRGSIIEMIVSVINELIDSLDKYESSLEEDVLKGNMIKLPRAPPLGVHYIDFTRDNEILASKWEEFNNLSKEYENKRDELKKTLQKKANETGVTEEIKKYYTNTLPNKTGADLTGDPKEFFTNQFFKKKYLPEYILTRKVDSNKDFHEPIFKDFEEFWMRKKKKSEISDEIDKLTSKAKQMHNILQQIQNDLEAVRKGYMDKYGIRESHIRNVEKEIRQMEKGITGEDLPY